MPKSEVAFLYDTFTMRQLIEKFDYHKFSSMPIINKKGEYVGTITEGDILRKLRQVNVNIKDAENITLSDIPRRVDNNSISVNADMEDIISNAVNQNFIPVVDDNNIFIGIITRKCIIEYLYVKSNLVDE